MIIPETRKVKARRIDSARDSIMPRATNRRGASPSALPKSFPIVRIRSRVLLFFFPFFLNSLFSLREKRNDDERVSERQTHRLRVRARGRAHASAHEEDDEDEQANRRPRQIFQLFLFPLISVRVSPPRSLFTWTKCPRAVRVH